MPGRVSVIVPTKNAARTIRECLASVRARSYPSVELIVVDNASIDGTLGVARSMADVVITAGPERSAQRNIGAAASTGEFLVFVDSDMRLAAGLAEEVVETFRADPDLQALVIPERSVGEGFWAGCRALEKELYLGDASVEAARVFRREAFAASGGYDERIQAGGEDWDPPERIAAGGGRIGRVSSETLHDEGRLSLVRHMAKKLYYGRGLDRYARKHPRRALGKVLRGVFVRKLPRLAKDPIHALGLLGMNALELVAVFLGLIVSTFRPHPAELRRARKGG